MVQLMSSGKKPGVKLEFDESLGDQLAPIHKRSKLVDSLTPQQFNMENTALSISASQYNPLEEPSPLGLRLKKTPSFLDLIQMRLSQENSSQSSKRNHKGSASSGATEKLKASNFPASRLKIGSWEYKSRYEGDLVAKCYFAKHKLVWEVLDGGLKNKIEIQWSDIMALKANFSDDGPDTLHVVLARQPLFFRETNPQPRKHTLWQATSDFTGGQASVNRCHFLESPRGLLGKHFEKLIQCDPRLNYLSQQPDIILESPFFEMKVSMFDEPKECRLMCGLPDVVTSPSGAQTSSSGNEYDFMGRSSGNFAKETPPSCSVMDHHAFEEISSGGNQRLNIANWDQIKFPGICPSMSMSDLVNHIGHCISEQITSSNPVLSRDGGKEIFEEITHYLLSDSQLPTATDEQTLMTRVNSLCCLLQDPETMQNLQAKTSGGLQAANEGEPKDMGTHFSTAENEPSSSCKQAPGMSRKDSVGELLLNLPRIASLPQFLFNGSEDNANQAR